MARAMGVALIVCAICFALLIVALMPATEAPTGYFSMQVKENPGMEISRHYFTPQETSEINAKIQGGN